MVFQHRTTGTRREGNEQGELHTCPTILSEESFQAAEGTGNKVSLSRGDGVEGLEKPRQLQFAEQSAREGTAAQRAA